ncbi:unnamed protein product [Macrosiphum euphorbiae]|uniref:DUF4371 domain-containing protein n=1 Tax=Macrosiphum euphorbiae TaxID=13131 RepID=A0AAV0WAY7_9HEMI|nr:unnamed protein product [Macrosiphum euphorbiae]
MERRISMISSDIFSNLQNEIANCSALSLALDESTDIQDKPQLAIFVRYVTMNMEVKEELLDLIALKETTRGCDIKDALDVVLRKAEVPIAKIVSVSTDGAPSITGCKNGLIGILKSDTDFPDFIPIHCIIHREHLTAKYFKYEHVMSVVLKIVNYIRSGSKIHRQFKNFVESLEDDIPNDVPWYCLVRWLSVNNVLIKFFDLLEPIKTFLKEKDKNFHTTLRPTMVKRYVILY